VSDPLPGLRVVGATYAAQLCRDGLSLFLGGPPCHSTPSERAIYFGASIGAILHGDLGDFAYEFTYLTHTKYVTY